MKKTKQQQSVFCLSAFLAVSVFSLPAFAQHAHEDLTVGRTNAGQLMIEFGKWDEAHELPAVSGTLAGWLGNHPGFAHLEQDEPAEDFYKLIGGTEIWLEVVSFEAGLQAWGPGFTGPYQNPGDDVLLGDEHLHKHLNWHIDLDDPSFDSLDAPWEATFRLVDKGTTGYLDSPNYTLAFAPEPGTLGLIGIGLLMLRRKARRG